MVPKVEGPAQLFDLFESTTLRGISRLPNPHVLNSKRVYNWARPADFGTSFAHTAEKGRSSSSLLHFDDDFPKALSLYCVCVTVMVVRTDNKQS